jgi:hypothetical protein
VGINADGLEFLVWAKREGVRFESTMTLGRQQFFWFTPEKMRRVLRKHGLHVSESETRADMTGGDGFAEPLFARLGAEETRSIDASPFEGATDVHDLNEPIPDSLKQNFSAVIDSGTLEHVFNLPQAIANAMEMVELGGHLLFMSPTNNEGGHGFYQFAPELFFRVLSPENGFTVERVLLREYLGRHWYEVVDPAELGHRSQFRSRGIAYLYVRARREEIVAPFESWPQQSDFVAEWGRASEGAPTTSRSSWLKVTARRFLPQSLLNKYSSLRWKRVVLTWKHPVLYQHQRQQFRRIRARSRPDGTRA